MAPHMVAQHKQWSHLNPITQAHPLWLCKGLITLPHEEELTQGNRSTHLSGQLVKGFCGVSHQERGNFSFSITIDKEERFLICGDLT
jgi:hypothetical protein